MGHLDGPNSNNPTLILKLGRRRSVIVLLIYQSFSMSPVRVELTPRITRFIFPQLKNRLDLEFSALCGQTSLKTSTDTRLPK
jgi:hypothetical protein